MKTTQDLITKYSEKDNVPTLDDLFERLSLDGTPKEKELISDGYISNFEESHNDYNCGKLNNLDDIWEMMAWLEKIKKLNPDLEYYYFSKAHVYKMLSSVNKEQDKKIKFNNLCIANFRKQREINSEDVTLLIDLANNIFTNCILTQNYQKQKFDEIKALCIEAIHLERKEEHQSNFFGFNGLAINEFLDISYAFLGLSINNNVIIHQEFIYAFKKAIEPYLKEDPAIYYHWANTLERKASWGEHAIEGMGKLSQEEIDDIWKDVKGVLSLATNIKSNDEHFLTSIGHLFTKIAERELLYSYFEIAFQYYSKALAINNKTWSNPLYTSSALQSMALIRLQNGEREESIQLFKQGLQIFDEAQKKVSDFQLSLNNGDYLYDYAKYLENFSNQDTLIAAKKQFEDSRILAEDSYTSPYYGLAKTLLRLGDKDESIKILTDCGELFSNEYHTHDFKEIKDDKDFDEIKGYFPKIMAKLKRKY